MWVGCWLLFFDQRFLSFWHLNTKSTLFTVVSRSSIIKCLKCRFGLIFVAHFHLCRNKALITTNQTTSSNLLTNLSRKPPQKLPRCCRHDDVFPHWSELYGFSPLWLRWWSFRSTSLMNAMSHRWKWWGFSLVWYIHWWQEVFPRMEMLHHAPDTWRFSLQCGLWLTVRSWTFL